MPRSTVRTHHEMELENFSKSFANEDVLRKAIIALLERTPLISGIRDTHGTGEVGKDIVFEIVDPFYGKELQACVIKNSPISGSVERKTGARAVLFQAEQALDTPIARTTDAARERVERVLIISPYECTTQTMQSIEGKLQKADRARVRFLCGRALWDQFVRYHPDYLLFNAGSLARLAATIVSSLDNDDSVQDALRQHGFLAPPHTLRGTYLPPKFAKRFHHYSLSLSLPKTADIRRPLKKTEINFIARNLISIAVFLSELGAKYEPAPDLRTKAAVLAMNLKKEWNEAFKKEWDAWNARREKQPKRRSPDEVGDNLGDAKRRVSEPSRDHDAIALPDSDAFANKISEILSEFSSAILNIQSVMDAANEMCSAEVLTEDAWLLSSLLPAYSFIENLSCAYPGVVQKERSVSSLFKFDRKTIDDLRFNFLIVGPPGTGKTSFCRWQAMEDLEKLPHGESRTVSHYIPMHRINSRGLASFEETFLSEPEIAKLWKTRSSHNWSFRVYMDGLDELADPVMQQKVLDLALSVTQAEKRLSVVVTGRDYISVPALKHFVRISVEQFDDPQLDEFIAGWFNGDKLAEQTFQQQLKEVPSLRELMRVPLLGTLVVKVHQSMRSLPGSRVKLYEMFTNLLAGGWDFAKQINRGSRFGPEPKLAVLANLADRLHEARLREFTAEHFKAAVKEVLPFYASRAPELLVELCRDGLVVPEGQYFGFLHHSFQEYLAATYLTELGGEKARRAVRRFLSGNEWWGEVVKFSIALSKNPQSTRRYIDKAAFRLTTHIQGKIAQSRQKELLEALALAYPGSTV